MIQRKQTLYLMAAIVMTVICLCMQIGSFKVGGHEVARVYNLWFTDPLGKRHLDTWPLFALLLPTAGIALAAIFLYKHRKAQALCCALNALLVVLWHVCFFCLPYIAFGKSWGLADFRSEWPAILPFVDFRPEWPAVLPFIALVFYILARRAILADERLVRSMDRIR